MFKIFSGNWRGIGADSGQSTLFMQVGLEFRKQLHHFKGAPLAVFMAIVLHADSAGQAVPSYDLLEQETGLARETISRAVDHLCNLEIDGQRVLLRYRLMDARTKRFIGGNQYIVFPTPEQVARYGSGKVLVEKPESDFLAEPNDLEFDFPDSGKSNDPEPESKIPESEKPEVGKSNLKNNQYLTRSSSSSSAPAAQKSQGENSASAETVLKLYRLLRPGHIAIPDTHWRETAERVLAGYLDRHGGDPDQAAEALRPYMREADRRGIPETNLCWLTEWAAVGKIPPQKPPRSGSRARNTAKNNPSNDDPDAIEKARRVAAEKLGRIMQEQQESRVL
jgi:hypothetical protein